MQPVDAILRRCNHNQLMEKYLVPKFGSTLEFLQHLARRLGKMKKGGVPDCEAAAKSILQDWNAGRISFYTVPPESTSMPTHVRATIVDGFGAAFDMKALLEDDAEVLAGSTLRDDVCTHALFFSLFLFLFI
jgi:nuclear GTP-binding protein